MSEATRVALVVVAGDPTRATEVVEHQFPGAEIEVLSMAELAHGSRVDALRRLRHTRAGILAFCYENLEVLDERPLHELAAHAMGATRLVLLDPTGRSRQRAVSRWPLHIAKVLTKEAFLGATLLATMNSVLPVLGRKRTRGALTSREDRDDSQSRYDVVYLRSLGQSTITNIGGTASHSVGIVRALGELGHNVHVISRPPAPDFDHERVLVTTARYEPTFLKLHPLLDLENHLRFLRQARRAVSHHPPHILYQRHTRFDVSGSVIALLLRRPLVLEHEGSEELKARTTDPTPCVRTLRACERFNHRIASLIVAVSDEVRLDLVRHRGVPVEKIIVNPSGVDGSRFAPGAGGAQRRDALGISPETTVVGFTGTFEPWHGIDTLAEAILREPFNTDLCFLLIGDGARRATFQLQLAHAHERCIFTGLVKLGDMPSYLDACDVLTCPTAPMLGDGGFYGSPTKLFEYMAAGKGIVASRIGQIATVIRHEENGLLVPTRDPQALRQALLRLIRDDELRTRLGQAAREDALRLYSWTRNAKTVLERIQPAAPMSNSVPDPQETPVKSRS
jgi:glycosyltransferase involved in cell wall biosynthesis